jgi:pimeloyl-ACP methyl ester carboxylesterase
LIAPGSSRSAKSSNSASTVRSTTVSSDVDWQIPDPHAVLDVAMPDGAIARVRRFGNLEAPRLILSHGNGFAIDGYYPFWRLFLDDFDVVVYDQRNHGWNPPCAGVHTQAAMADDMESVCRSVAACFGARKTAGIFHSLSAIVALLHAAKNGYRWDTLVLVDPPLVPPDSHPLGETARRDERHLDALTRRRRRRFASPDALAADFKRARRLSRWVPGAAELMARAITRPAADGGVAIVCPPELEASIYLQNAESPAWSLLPTVARDALVVSGDPSMAGATPPAKVCATLPQAFGIEVVAIPGTGHLLQIEQPDLAAAIVRRHLRARAFDQHRTSQHCQRYRRDGDQSGL